MTEKDVLLLGNKLAPLGGLRLLLYNALWLPVTLTYVVLVSIILPDRIAGVVGSGQKGNALGVLVAVGAVLQFLGPVFAIAGDRSTSRWGRIRPFVAFMIVAQTPAFIVLAYGTQYWHLLCGYLLFQFASTVGVQPYTAVIPALVPEDQRGAASGWMGGMQFAGTLFASLCGILLGADLIGEKVTYLAVGVLNVVGGLATLVVLKERKADIPTSLPSWSSELRGIVIPFQVDAFKWLFIISALAGSSTSIALFFLQYYLGDVVQHFDAFGITLATDPQAATGVYLAVNLVFGTVFAVLAGPAADRYGRKRLACLGLLVGIAPPVLLAVTASFAVTLVSAALGGFANALTTPPLWALAADYSGDVPDRQARHMAVYWLNTLVPQLLIPLLCGQLLDAFDTPGRDVRNAYTIAWLVAAALMPVAICMMRYVTPSTPVVTPLAHTP